MFLSDKFRWLGVLLGVALLLSVLPLAAPIHAQDDPAQTILTLLNAERSAAGLAPLALNPQLTAAAQRHSDDMAAGDFLDHVGSDGSQFWERILEAGYPMNGGAENILYRWDADPLGAFEQWKESPLHVANMMSPDYTEVGIAWAASASGKYYFTMVLARREGAAAPAEAPRNTDATPTLPPLQPPPQPTVSASGVGVLERLLRLIFWVQSMAAGGPAAPAPTAAPALPAPPTATLAPLQPPAIPTATLPPIQPPTVPPPTLPPTVPPLQPPTMPPPTVPPLQPPTVPPPPTQAPQLTVPDVRIISDGQSVTVLNVAGRPVDLRPLRLQSGAGALDATLWDNGYLSAPLDAFPAGDCVQVWGLAVPGTLPQPPQCGTRHAWLSVGPQYAFWEGVVQFQVLYGGRVVAVCQVGVPCDVSFSGNAQPPAPPTFAQPPTAPAQAASGAADVRLLYNANGLTLLNVSGRRVNLAPLVFQSATGTMAATEWDNGYLSAPLNAFPTGDCLQVWNYGAAPMAPPAECRTRHAWLEMGNPYQFWRADFLVLYNGQVIGTCPLAAGMCGLRLP